jgi:hypothetical protein
MVDVVEALHHMEKRLPSDLGDSTAAALNNALGQFFHLQIYLIAGVLPYTLSILLNG